MLFEGGRRAVDWQLEAAQALVGGERAGDEIWDAVRERPRPELLAPDPVLRALHDRIRLSLAGG
jgi:hypothetical protein